MAAASIGPLYIRAIEDVLPPFINLEDSSPGNDSDE